MARGGPMRGRRGYGVPAAVPLLPTTACGGGAAKERPGASPPATGANAAGKEAPDATNEPVIDADPARLPTTRKAALSLIGQVIAGPDNFGPGVVARTPYESDPDSWPVLGTDCVWRQQEPGRGVARSTGATGAEREGIAQRLFRTSHPGISRTLSFSPSRRVRYETGLFLHRVEEGRARFLGPTRRCEPDDAVWAVRGEPYDGMKRSCGRA
ncbi:hypothetical protein ACH4CE_09735 [Streptomyces gelaticus]|uniref:hypothetical protein n=1 Tax=Streptomyces gelaticus TaxID=285446 RepID=UPI0037A5CFB3